jgi:hypothetical protein
MKSKRLVLISCLAAGALIASPALGEIHKKSMTTSASRPHRMAARTTQVTPNTRMGVARSYTGNRMGGTRYYGGAGYSGTRYYGTGGYYGGTSYYYGGYPYYSYYSGWPYDYYGYYPYSYYAPAYGYDTSTVAAVQQRLGEIGYYYGAVDGIMGPRTRAAIAAYESGHGLAVDGTISQPLLDRLGLA